MGGGTGAFARHYFGMAWHNTFLLRLTAPAPFLHDTTFFALLCFAWLFALAGFLLPAFRAHGKRSNTSALRHKHQTLPVHWQLALRLALSCLLAFVFCDSLFSLLPTFYHSHASTHPSHPDTTHPPHHTTPNPNPAPLRLSPPSQHLHMAFPIQPIHRCTCPSPSPTQTRIPITPEPSRRKFNQSPTHHLSRVEPRPRPRT